MEFSSEGSMIQLDSSFESASRHLLCIQNNFSCIWISVLAMLKSAESGIMYKLFFKL